MSETEKITDIDVIQAYGFCQCKKEGDCDGCPFDKGKDDASCLTDLRMAAYDLMCRQDEKIKFLESVNKSLTKNEKNLKKKVSNRAMKQFAKRLLSMKQKPEFPWDDFYVTETDIESLLKQMVIRERNKKK